MTMDEALDILQRDAALHMTQRCSERELDALEAALGKRLPAEFRALLERVGGGILYDKHEVFGGRRLMVHDIELVPDLLTVRRQLEEARPPWPDHLVPIHRCEGELHLLDLSRGGPCPVLGGEGRAWPDLAAFLEAVVLPPPRPAERPARDPLR
jgi:hypothetical protein